MIDIGANLTDPRFANDLPAVIARAQTAGVVHVIATGTSLLRSATAATLRDRWPHYLSCTAGIHPHEAAHAPADWVSQLRELATRVRPCAIGETGLDFNRDFSPRAIQERVFSAHLELAIELALPVFVHDRDSQGRVAALLSQHRAKLVGVVVHCFTGTGAELDALLALDCHIGITGWVCDERRGAPLAALLPRIPSNRLLIETDAPYLTPRSLPIRPRPQRNEPAFLAHIAQVVAALRDESATELSAATTTNARRLFRLGAAHI